MQLLNNSRICCLSRKESLELASGRGSVADSFRRIAAARAARAWARSSLSSLDPKKKGLDGENGALCFGLGLRVSAIRLSKKNCEISEVWAINFNFNFPKEMHAQCVFVCEIWKWLVSRLSIWIRLYKGPSFLLIVWAKTTSSWASN